MINKHTRTNRRHRRTEARPINLLIAFIKTYFLPLKSPRPDQGHAPKVSTSVRQRQLLDRERLVRCLQEAISQQSGAAL